MLKTELKYQLLMPENFKETQQCFAEHQERDLETSGLHRCTGYVTLDELFTPSSVALWS